jgi:hypothetical protein
MSDADHLRALVLADRDALREHLDGLNESGEAPVAVGIDAAPQPFLITLVGPYAESEDVFFDSPWQGDTDYGEPGRRRVVPKQPRCDDCRAMVPRDRGPAIPRHRASQGRDMRALVVIEAESFADFDIVLRDARRATDGVTVTVLDEAWDFPIEPAVTQ